jgi:hypothetical protein
VDDSAAERITRLHLALAGGERARFADSREIRLALWLESRWPGTGAQFAAAFNFHALAARWAVTDGGAAGVVFGAAGFPGAVPMHRAALEAAPGARFVYADTSGPAAYLNGELLAEPGVTAVRATVRDPSRLMSLPEVTALGVPVQMQVQLCAHFWDDAMCRDLTGQYAALLPAGSTLALSLWSPDGTPDGEAFLDMLAAAAAAPAYGHSPAAVAGWLRKAGLDLLGAGVADVRAYGRGWAEDAGLAVRSPGRVVKAVARKARGTS